MKLKLSEKCGIFNKIYGLYFSQWGDLWPYRNAYVRPETRAKSEISALQTHNVVLRSEIFP